MLGHCALLLSFSSGLDLCADLSQLLTLALDAYKPVEIVLHLLVDLFLDAPTELEGATVKVTLPHLLVDFLHRWLYLFDCKPLVLSFEFNHLLVLLQKDRLVFLDLFKPSYLKTPGFSFLAFPLLLVHTSNLFDLLLRFLSLCLLAFPHLFLLLTWLIRKVKHRLHVGSWTDLPLTNLPLGYWRLA